MSLLSRRRALFAVPESTFGTHPDTTGATSKYIPCTSLGQLSDNLELLDTNFQTGRGYPTAPEPGADGWQLEFSTFLYGMSDYAETSAAASATADDWLDMLLDHILGTHASTTGVGLTSGTIGAGTIVADTSGFALQQLILVTHTSASRGQWHQVSAVGSAPTYSVVPNVFATVGSTWEAPGTKVWQPNLGLTTSLAFLYKQDSVWYSLTGGKITAAKISGDTNKLATLQITVRGVSKAVVSAPASIPAALAPTYSPLHVQACAAHFGTTLIDTAGIEIDLGLDASEIMQSDSLHGRSGDETLGIAPKVTLKPLFSSTFQDLRRNQTKAPLIVGLGKGTVVSTHAFGMGLLLNEVTAVESNPADEGNRLRDSLVFQASDPVEFSAGIASRFMTLARA